jgi:hypothetical protein
MTKLIILLCFSFGRVAGQTAFDSTGRYIAPKAGAMFIDPGFYQPGNHDFVAKADSGLYDTIPVIMLVGDTAQRTEEIYSQMDTLVSNCGTPDCGSHYEKVYVRHKKAILQPVWQIRGYEVRENNPTFDQTYHGTLAIAVMSWVDHFTHIAYLDEKKKPLKLYVWQSVKP